MLADPLPGPAWVVTEGPAPVVVPETLPPPAVTDDCMPPAEEAEVFGALSPGLRCTVLQLLLLGAEVEVVVLPFEEDELDELELSAWANAAAAIEAASAAPQNTDRFITFPRAGVGLMGARPMQGLCGPCIGHASCASVAIPLVLAGVFAALFAVLARVLVGVIEACRSGRRTARADRRSGRALASGRAAGAEGRGRTRA